MDRNIHAAKWKKNVMNGILEWMNGWGGFPMESGVV